jgi:crossover junction endodeoxyribonuclease RusA
MESREAQRMTICFTVHGNAVPKQSFRVGNGHGFTSPRVKAWHDTVAWAAVEAMTGIPPLQGPVKVTLDFYLTHRRRADVDNYSKGILDPMTHAGVFCDDSQVIDLHVRKHYCARGEGRVVVTVDECGEAA